MKHHPEAIALASFIARQMLPAYSADDLLILFDTNGKAVEMQKLRDHELDKRNAMTADDAVSTHGRVMEAAFGSTVTPDRMFLRDVEDELIKARRKFPSSNAALAAATEELGEVAKACLSESPQRIYREAVQLASMAARIASEGDPSLNSYREHNFGVDAGPARGQRP